jgi:hypothetical protein
VLPGDELVATFEIVRIKGPIVELEVTVVDGEGAQLTRAQAKVLAPDAAYRAWWEARYTLAV